MSREQLMKVSCNELRERAKALGISGRWKMTKEQLIDVILRADSRAEDATKDDQGESGVDIDKIENNNRDETDDLIGKGLSDDERAARRMPYIEDANVGKIVAFRLPDGRTKSAKVILKSTKNRKFKLETKYGAEFIVSYDDIVWVRYGKRWPRYIYSLLKGGKNGRHKTKKVHQSGRARSQKDCPRVSGEEVKV